MKTELVALAGLMFLATYPMRAIPLLAPGMDRLPPRALLYLRLVGPAVLAAIAAANTLVTRTPAGTQVLHLDVEAAGVLVCLVIVWWRRNLFLGLLAGVALVAIARYLNLA